MKSRSFILQVNGYAIPPVLDFNGGQVIVGWKDKTKFDMGSIDLGREDRLKYILLTAAKRSDPNAIVEEISNEYCDLNFSVVYRLGCDEKAYRADRKYPQADIFVVAGDGSSSIHFCSYAAGEEFALANMDEMLSLFQNARLVDGNLLIPFDRTEVVEIPPC